MNKIKLLNQLLNKASVGEIELLSENEILDLAMERPMHAGQYGFLMPNNSHEQFADKFCALMKRLQKVENLKEKMLKRSKNS